MIASAAVDAPLSAPDPEPENLSNQEIRALFARAAEENGFRRIGVARAGRPPRFDRFEAWLEAGRHGSMRYLEESRALREDPARLLPGVRSVVVLSAAYPAAEPAADDGAKIARYALAEDYHRKLRRRAQRVVSTVHAAGVSFDARICVDSAPVSERDFAAAAGIGWIGKNGMVMNAENGSWFLLCVVLTTLDLPEDVPVADQCGACTRCLDACPTEAFVAPRVLDAKRCLSYWTIEQRGVIPDAIADRMDGWVFGCDICQEACPYNRPIDTAPLERRPPGLAELLDTHAGEWRRRFRATPLARAGASGMRRNAAAAAGRSGDPSHLPALGRLAHAAHPVVAEQARRAERMLARS